MTRTRYHHSAPRPAAPWVRLFGPVELSNQWGAVSENPGRRSLPWLLLKYLLANAGREVDSGELERALWPGRAETENNLRVRLHRLREALAPLGLDGPEGLVLYCAGRFALNPDIPIQTDGERFSALLRREGRAAPEDRDGLTACGQALELYRGPFLEYTAPAPWLEGYRAQYARQFRTLAWHTLRRIQSTGDDGLLELLCRRAAWAAPGDQELQDRLIHQLAASRRQTELLRHMAQLDWERGAGHFQI